MIKIHIFLNIEQKSSLYREWETDIIRGKKSMKPKKELKDLNLMDRFLFAEAADDTEFMEILLGIIFDTEIHLLHPPQTEKEERDTFSQKQIRLDVWAMDEEQVIYDTEPQRQDTHNLPKRSRYYQGLVDSRLLRPGETQYNQLNDVYMLVIASFDLFGKGLYQYTFRMTCEQVPGLVLEDGATRIFFNTKGTEPQGVSPELVELLHYFEHTTAETAERSGSLRIQKLQEKVEAIKSSEEMGVKYMRAWEEKAFERQEGFEEGLECAFEALGSLVRDGVLSLEQAAERMNGRKEEFLNWYHEKQAKP